MPPPPPNDAGVPPVAGRHAVALAEALATALKACALYPGDHPRVRDASQRLVQQLQPWLQPRCWWPVRIKGQQLWLGDERLDDPSPAVRWLIGRCRDIALAGFEFSAQVDADAVTAFGIAMRAIGAGRTLAAEWPADDPRVRPLALVFAGRYAADDGAGDAGVDTTQAELLATLMSSPEVQAQLAAIEQGCAEDALAPDTGEVWRVDVVSSMVDLLPADIAADPVRAAEAVRQILASVHAGLPSLRQAGAPDEVDEVTRTALTVAKKYFVNAAPGLVVTTQLPTGRPDDAAITADLPALRRELAAIQEPPVQSLARAVALGQALATDLRGIYMHLLVRPELAGTLPRLQECLPKVLSPRDPEHRQLLDTYLRPRGSEQVAPVGDESAVSVLQVLEQTGLGPWIVDRGYINAGLVARTYPHSLPLFARILGAVAPGRQVLRDGLLRLDGKQLGIGADELVATDALADPTLLAALVEIGGTLVLPILSRVPGKAAPWLRELLVCYLRTLPLPAGEAAALRTLEASALPVGYLGDLCRLAAGAASRDAHVCLHSLRLLTEAAFCEDRGYVELRLQAIQAMVHLPGPETEALLRQLARRGRWSRFDEPSRRVRREAATALWQLRAMKVTS